MIVFTACSIHFIWSNSCRGFYTVSSDFCVCQNSAYCIFHKFILFSTRKIRLSFQHTFFLCKNQRNVTNKNIKPISNYVCSSWWFVFQYLHKKPFSRKACLARVRLFPEYMFGQNWCSRISIISHLYNTLWWVKSTAVNKWTDAVSRTDTSKTMRFIKYIYETLIRALACSCSQLHRFHSLRET